MTLSIKCGRLLIMNNDYKYTTNNNTICITKYTGPGGVIAIPSLITNLPVTSIGDYAFSHCIRLTSVTIPNSVTSIGNWAFSYCSGLMSVTIGNSVTSIGDYTFSHCFSLTSVAIPNSVTSIGDSAFCGCSSLTSVTIPNSVTSIGNYAFSHCTSLTGVTIPNSVTSIGSYAFYNCTNLTSVTIPNNFPRKVILPDGEIIGYKKLKNNVICKLKIPAKARRVGGIVSRKCRAEFAVVLEGEGKSLTKHFSEVVYKVGERVKPNKFDANPLVECSAGIHFFLTREEADKFEM